MSGTKSTQSRRRHRLLALLEDHSFLIGLAIRLILMFALPRLMDDGLLLQGVRYTDIDYDVFTDAAEHIAHGRSPYARHTYRYTPFLAKLLALPIEHYGRHENSNNSSSNNNNNIFFLIRSLLFSTRYFGKLLFCIADALCGYIISRLRRRQRQRRASSTGTQQQQQQQQPSSLGWWWKKYYLCISPELMDALWWLYNPLPINICTRGSAESLVVLLPVLTTVAIADMYEMRPSASNGTRPIILRACLTGIIHGIGIHAKLYPVIYTVSFMANFARQEQQRVMMTTKKSSLTTTQSAKKMGWIHNLSDHMRLLENCFCCAPSSAADGTAGFPWRHPLQISTLAILWVERLFFTLSSVLFLIVSMGTVVALTYAAVYFHGREALDEGLLYHFQRVDHRHNYSMYWYWIYLARGRASQLVSPLSATLNGSGAEALLSKASSSSSPMGFLGHIPLIPQIIILGFASLGIAPYDLTLALFAQTFAFVAFNKVMTAQYFTWYLCMLPLCADRIQWGSKRMILSLGFLLVSIVTWLLSAFTLEMLGWRSHRQVWLASVIFFLANVNLLSAILHGYKVKKLSSVLSTPGAGWATKTKIS